MENINNIPKMTVSTSEGDINICIQPGKDVVIKMSGGADSSMLMYLLAKYKNEFNPDINFIIVSSVAATKPYQYIYAKRVLEFINGIYPLGNYQHYHNHNRAGQYYSEDIEKLNREHCGENTVQFMGITANPSVEEMKKWELYDEYRDPNRDPGFETATHEAELAPGAFKRNRPFAKYSKKAVAELYQKFNLTDSLFPLTRSCEKKTFDFGNHCGKCWWCRERKWAFGRLDK